MKSKTILKSAGSRVLGCACPVSNSDIKVMSSLGLVLVVTPALHGFPRSTARGKPVDAACNDTPCVLSAPSLSWRGTFVAVSLTPFRELQLANASGSTPGLVGSVNELWWLAAQRTKTELQPSIHLRFASSIPRNGLSSARTDPQAHPSLETGREVCFNLSSCENREREKRPSVQFWCRVFGNPAAILEQGISNLQCTPESRDALGAACGDLNLVTGFLVQARRSLNNAQELRNQNPITNLWDRINRGISSRQCDATKE